MSDPVTEDDLLLWGLSSTRRMVARTCSEIARVIAGGRWCVAYSGGKDSLVLVALARTVDPLIPITWTDEEAVLPETVAAIDAARERWGEPWLLLAGPDWHGEHHAWGGGPRLREPYPGVVMTPGLTHHWLIAEGYSSLVGTRRAENATRAKRGRRGPGWYAPLHDWSEALIWAAIAGLGLPINGLYGRLVGAGWPRERCKTVPLAYALDGSYGPYARLWPAEMAALRDRISAGG